MSHLTDLAERRGLDYAYGFALVNLAWAPGPGARRLGRRRARPRDLGRRPLPHPRPPSACLALPYWAHGDPQAPRSQPRRDRRPRLPHLRASSGSATVAVAAPDDRGALHARVGRRDGRDRGLPRTPRSTSGPRSRAGADAIHPGYGFLAENPDFAEAVEAAGLVFVGPSPDALRAGGDKLEAKRIAARGRRAGRSAGRADEIGYPLVIKAAAGGGGRGMRVVRAPEELDEALAAARREAKAAFGDDRVFCERYVERPRHVEIQLLADAHGNVVALGERECSIQRRHQKVLEESPSPALDAALRARDERGRGRVRARDRLPQRRDGRVHAQRPRLLLPRAERPHPGRAPGHRGRHGPRPRPGAAPDRAGRAARGRTRPVLTGHAVEVRLYAEDPRTFLPQAGRIERLRLPDGVRVDAGVEEGDEVGVAYDPMIAKLIAHGETRRRGARPPPRGARRDRGRGADDEPAVPALARRAPGGARGRDDDGVPRRLPAALGAAALARPRLARPWRLNLPAPPRRPPPGPRARRARTRAGWRRAERAHRARCPAR